MADFLIEIYELGLDTFVICQWHVDDLCYETSYNRLLGRYLLKEL